jgi:hypothetical protein
VRTGHHVRPRSRHLFFVEWLWVDRGTTFAQSGFWNVGSVGSKYAALPAQKEVNAPDTLPEGEEVECFEKRLSRHSISMAPRPYLRSPASISGTLLLRVRLARARSVIL